MEQEKSFMFKLFVPPRLNNAQVSAVKPQKNTGDGEFFQDFNKGMEDDYNLPFVMKNTSKHLGVTGYVSQKVTPVPEIEQENMETMGELYSKLYKEAEKIKRWKVSIEYEFENERLSLKLEDEMHENKGLLKEMSRYRNSGQPQSSVAGRRPAIRAPAGELTQQPSLALWSGFQQVVETRCGKDLQIAHTAWEFGHKINDTLVVTAGLYIQAVEAVSVVVDLHYIGGCQGQAFCHMYPGEQG
ncbi:UNVERIFIED_CONTAM: hypothetical protein K2H54_061400 [Gekko kuhli]